MALDVPVPDPPTLEDTDPAEYEDVTVVADRNYHRDDIEAFFEAGAWTEAFQQWASETHLDERAFGIVVDLGLFDRFDFFWDDFATRVGYHTPGIPADWRERKYHAELTSWEQVSAINAALAELGATVSDHLLESYVDWDSDYEAPSDLPDFS